MTDSTTTTTTDPTTTTATDPTITDPTTTTTNTSSTGNITEFTYVKGNIIRYNYQGDIETEPWSSVYLVIPTGNQTYTPAVGDRVTVTQPLNTRFNTGMRRFSWYNRRFQPRNDVAFLHLYDGDIAMLEVTEVGTVNSSVVFANRFNYGRVVALVKPVFDVAGAKAAGVIFDVQVDEQSVVTNNVGDIDATVSANTAVNNVFGTGTTTSTTTNTSNTTGG